MRTGSLQTGVRLKRHQKIATNRTLRFKRTRLIFILKHVVLHSYVHAQVNKQNCDYKKMTVVYLAGSRETPASPVRHFCTVHEQAPQVAGE